MKRKMVLAFLAGLVLPLGMMALMEKDSIPQEILPTEREPVSILVQVDDSVMEMDCEDYIIGVVLTEMPADFPEEALKAQAVVARTYAMKRVEQGSKHGPYDLCTDPGCCQGWRNPEAYLADGGKKTALRKVERAVEDTAGLVLRYQGELIDATYFSCSGGSTEAAVEVWGGDVPYLQAVESPGEEASSHYTDQVEFSLEEFARITGCVGEPSTWLGQVTSTRGGGVATMELSGVTFRGTELRKILGLSSTDFSMELLDDRIVVTTHGFGHRVGMSQYGAQAMADNGSDFAEILEHYYQGTELTGS